MIITGKSVYHLWMKSIALYSTAFFLLFCSAIGIAQVKYLDYSTIDPNKPSTRLSNQYYPQFGVMQIRETDFTDDAYIQTINDIRDKTPYNFVIPFMRFPNHCIVDQPVYDYMKRLAEYASKNNVQLVPDLDIRNARRTFLKKYPEEHQKMLRLKEVKLSAAIPVETVIPSVDLEDHMTGGHHYYSLEGQVLRIYGYRKVAEGVDADILQDITSNCEVIFASGDSVKVRLPAQNRLKKEITHACVMVAFKHVYPDVFGPHLIPFQHEIIAQYKDVPFIGVCKDEWGHPAYFPRYFHQGMYDFWYSEHRAKMYADDTGGRELLADCLLMALGQEGKETERQVAINNYQNMNWRRNTEIEAEFYNSVKSVFGKDAVVTVHATWWPYPDRCEYMKNGLSWWSAKRDWAQTDEVTPYGVRTALSKKWGSAVWYNMYYKNDYAQQIWSSALGGGRIDFLGYQALFNQDMMKAECKVRLLNYISKSPLDCQVAVIFGHTNAMNWAAQSFEDTGMSLIDQLWRTGYPADLIPSTEITNGSLRIDENGTVWYGVQSYSAVVLYKPEFEDKSVADFFNKATKGNTTLFRIGDWTKGFKGNPVDGNQLLPSSMIVANSVQDIFSKVCQALLEKNIQKQTPATLMLDNEFFRLRDWKYVSYAPPTAGFCRLTDGTVIYVSGTGQISGDTIRQNFKINGFNAYFDAVGVAALRVDAQGNPDAIVAGGLKSLKVNHFEINLKDRVDVVLWKDTGGNWQGAVQDGDVPDELKHFTSKWEKLITPIPPEPLLPRPRTQ